MSIRITSNRRLSQASTASSPFSTEVKPIPTWPKIISRTRRLVALSSTIRATSGRPASASSSASISARASAGPAAEAGHSAASGSRISTVNADPRPGSEVQSRSAPSSSAKRRARASPTPVPPRRRVEDPSAWVKLSNSRSLRAMSKPTPVSVTARRYRSSPSAWADRTTSPTSVNLRALDSSAPKSCFSRSASPRTASFRSSTPSRRRSRPRSAAAAR